MVVVEPVLFSRLLYTLIYGVGKGLPGHRHREDGVAVRGPSRVRVLSNAAGLRAAHLDLCWLGRCA